MYSKKCCQLFILSSKSSLEEGAMMTTYLGNYFYFETMKYIQIPSASHSQPCLDHLCLAGRHAGQISKTHLKCLRCWDSSTAWWKVLHACLTSYSILQYSLWAHERCRSKWIAWLGACRISSRWLAEPHQARQLPAHYAKFTSNIPQRMNEILQPEFFGYLLQNGSRDIKMEPSSNRNWQSPVVDYAPLERVYYLLQ